MTGSLKKREWIVPLLFVLALAATLLVGANAFGGSSANAQPGSSDPSDVVNAVGFTPPGAGEDSWPPRPRGATGELQPVGDIFVGGFGDSITVVTPWTLISTQPEVAAELGTNWNHLSTATAEGGKGQTNLGTEYVFFSLDKNQTVIVIEGHDGSTSVETIAPEHGQPIFSADELAEATEIARAHFLAEGHSEVANYVGNGIRAITPEGNTYPVRMVSIVLGVDSYQYPEFEILVDLTNGIVADKGAGA